MGLESIRNKFENSTEELRAKQAANFEKTFQKNNADGVKPRHITTINEDMAGKSVNGVTFARRIFTLDGEKVEGVFPIFKSEFNCNLHESMYKASDNEQMKYCTKKLVERIDREPEFAKKFTQRQLEQIRNGEPRISGLTWHHNEIPGRMQLVNANDHSAARHTGGRSVWGGGSESR